MFDADFCPPADFLMRTVHFFADPKVGVVQTRWSYLNRDYNFLTEVEAMLLDGHFILEHGARSRAGYFFNFNGTAGILREEHDRRRRRLAARYPHRGFRPQLPRAAQGLALRLPAGPGLPVGTAGGDARLPGAAVALGQGADAGGQEAAARASCRADIPKRVKVGSVPAPHAEHLLSADDRGLGADAAGDDRALLHGRVADGVPRPAADRGVVLVDLAVLRGGAARAVSEELEALDPAAADADGGRAWG